MSSTPPDPAPDTMQLAGMALRNGVLILGPTRWAVAVRGDDGQVTTQVGRRPSAGEQLADRVPLLRGPVRLANMLRVLPHVRREAPTARLALESRGIVGGMVFGSLATGLLRRRLGRTAVTELASGAISLATTIGSMRTGEVAAYHGAEHKAIGAYEQGIDAADATREHARCGTQLALPMLVFGAIATQGALALAPRSPRAARTIGQLVGVAAATELFRAAQRGKGSALATVAAKAGLTLQTVATTAEPTRDQLDVAEAALAALLAAEAAVAA
ncbi:MAG: hypothetical protein JWM98_358 [Thermoleophilia bacterium]|nr:hypothetical protein [Thermoleophilia bacterium]